MIRDPRAHPDSDKMPDDPPERDENNAVKQGTEDRDPPPPTQSDWDLFYRDWIHGTYDNEPYMQFAFKLGRDYERRIVDDNRDVSPPKDPRGK